MTSPATFPALQELPPLPEPSETSSYTWLGEPLEYSAKDMRSYARAASKQAGDAPRMLTNEEMLEAKQGIEISGEVPLLIAIQRKFCEVNGIAPPTLKD